MKKAQTGIPGKTRFINLFPLPLYLYLAIPAIFVLLALVLFSGESRLSLSIYDSLLWVREPVPESDEIVFLNIDDPSLDFQGEWPWQRTDLGRYLMELEFYSPKAQILDINFDLASNRGLSGFLRNQLLQRGFSIDEIVNAAEDPVFGNMLRSISPLEVASLFDGDGRFRALSPEIGFETAASGFVNVVRDRDGIIRRFTPRIGEEWILGIESFDKANPQLELRLSEEGLSLNGNDVRPAVIPREPDGSILIEWPRKDYPLSFDHIGFETLPRIASVRESMWFNFGLLEFWAVLPAESLGAQALDVYRQAEDQFLAASFTAEPDGLDNYFLLRTAAEDLLRSYLTTGTISAILEGQQNNPFILSGELDFSEIQPTIDAVVADLRRLTELQNDLRPRVQDRYVILAFSASGSTDIGATPFISEYANAGMYGSILNMLLLAEQGQHRFLRTQPLLVNIGLSLAFAAAISVIIRKRSVLFSVSVVSGAILVIMGLQIALIRFAALYFDPILIIMPSFLSGLSIVILQFFGTEGEKRWLYQAFGRYISHEFIDLLVEHPDRLKLGGEEREITMMFTDIKDFSGLAQLLNPTDLVALLNLYFTRMSDIIMDHGGTIDKFEGDAIVAFFGAPIHSERHAQQAVEAAIEMQNAFRSLTQEIQDQFGIDRGIETRVGINSGTALVGNLGTSRRMDYTAMGLVVNTASRLEGANKILHTSVLLSESTFAQLDDSIAARLIGKIKLIGIDEPVAAYELRGKSSDQSKSRYEADVFLSKAVSAILENDYLRGEAELKAASMREPGDPVIRILTKLMEKKKDGKIRSIYPLSIKMK